MKVQLSSVRPDIKIGLAVVATLIILFLDIWALAGIFNDQVTLFRYLNYFGYYIPLLTLGVMVFALVMTRGLLLRFLVGIVALPALLIPYLLASLPFSGGKWALSDQVSGTDVSVITYSKMSRNSDYERIAQLLDCSKTDIFLLQEVPDLDTLIAANPELMTSCNYSFEGGEYKSLALLTRFPIVSATAKRSHSTFTIDVDGTPVSLMTARIEKSLGSGGIDAQSRQITEITEELQEDSAVIFAGDFNSTPHNNTIFRMKESMAYAAPEGAMFSTFTFPAEGRWYASLGALIRIDHIFYRGLSLRSSRVLEDSYGSDHYPVKAVFTVPVTLEGTDE